VSFLPFFEVIPEIFSNFEVQTHINMDWKEALGALAAEDFPQAPDEPQAPEETMAGQGQSAPLIIGIDRKQRKGKTATIIEGFECGDDELKRTAARLKSSIGVGGSARGGEILLQGDVRQKAAELLRKEGYIVKIR